MVDRILAFQLINVAVGAGAPIMAIIFLSDAEILTSQAIVSLAQIAVTLLAVTLSTASLEHEDATRKRALLSVVVCGFIWAAAWNLHQQVSDYTIIATVFFTSLVIGELSALPRARIINSSGKRLPLVTTNTIATGTRLVSFLSLLPVIGALFAFLLSAALSNVVRTLGLIWAAQGLQTRVDAAPRNRQAISFARRVGAYLDRNPSVLVVLVLTSFTPLLGLPAENYALAILIMNFAIAISGVMWVRFENSGSVFNKRTVPSLLGIVTFVTALGLTCVYLVPEGLVAAESLGALQIHPVTLVVFPILFGLSCGINVFLYGSVVPLFRAPIIALVFLLLGQWGFAAGIVMNFAAAWAVIKSKKVSG